MNIERTDKWIKVSAEEGTYLTEWVDGDDILNYNSYRVLFSPLNADLSKVREVSEEENKIYNDIKEDKEKEIYGV